MYHSPVSFFSNFTILFGFLFTWLIPIALVVVFLIILKNGFDGITRSLKSIDQKLDKLIQEKSQE